MRVRAVIGLDGGSTSSKAVLMDEAGEILTKQYQLSKGNPIADTKQLLARMKAFVHDQGATLDVLGFGATGYAADVLEESLRADVNIVETVAHMMAAVKFFGDVDVICDIGGQDIKVLFMTNGDIRNFRLSNQCSAGNGMLLQAMANQFGVPVTEYADAAFKAGLAPKFSYGCAVFLDADRVNFQKEGYAKEELLAGLAMVLPKNVWQYVVQIPRMARSAAATCSRAARSTTSPPSRRRSTTSRSACPDAEVHVHPHPGEAGAIGAAIETLRVVQRRGTSTFVGLDAAIDLAFTTDERRDHALPLLPERLLAHLHRHEDARRHDQPLHLRLLLREGHRRDRWKRYRRSTQSARSREAVPEPGRLRGEAGVPALLRRRADAGDGTPSTTTRK